MMIFRAIQVCLFSAVVVTNQGCFAEQPGGSWPNWMGKNHDGISTQSGWSTNWPETGLQKVWEREIGIGFSSVAISGGRLFSLGHVSADDGSHEEGRGTETVVCLDAKNGNPIWSHSYPSALVDNLYEGGPGSTPTIDGDHVYTLGKDGQLFCFQVNDGEIVWQRELQRDLHVGLPEWGFNSSPFILEDQLILQGGRVVSYDKRSGEINWQSPQRAAGYGSAALLQQDGKRYLATLDSEGLQVLDAESGGEIDSFPWPSPFRTNSTTPIVHGNTIFVSTGYQVGCGLFQFAGNRLDLVYDNRDMRNHFNNSILLDGYLYGFDGNSNLGRVVRLVCMNYETGEIEWTHRGLGCGSLIIADEKLVLLSDDGHLVIANADPREFEELARDQILEGRCWTIPVLVDGHVYARNAKGNLICVKLPAASGSSSSKSTTQKRITEPD